MMALFNAGEIDFLFVANGFDLLFDDFCDFDESRLRLVEEEFISSRVSSEFFEHCEKNLVMPLA